jgi:hypothetical protein
MWDARSQAISVAVTNARWHWQRARDFNLVANEEA